MASKTQEEILKRFEEVSGKGSATDDSERESVETATSPSGIGAAATPAGQDVEGGAKTEQQGSGGGSTAETVMKDVFESGLGVVPLIGDLFGLFGGGGSNSPAPLLKYQMPSSISFMSADTGDQLGAADYDQMGLPRAYDAGDTADSGTSNAVENNATAPGASSASAGAAAPQITFNVQAMDAQSFLDRSSDLAQAVRSAMLNMSSINDVVSEL